MIRQAKELDIPAIVRLEEQAFNHSLGYTFYVHEILHNPSSIIYICELNNQIIGVLGIRLLDENAEILNLVVDENYRAQGYGKKLMNEAFKVLEEKQIKNFTLEVRKSNKQARRFYESLGFNNIYIRKDYYENEDAYVYIKEVTLW